MQIVKGRPWIQAAVQWARLKVDRARTYSRNWSDLEDGIVGDALLAVAFFFGAGLVPGTPALSVLEAGAVIALLLGCGAAFGWRAIGRTGNQFYSEGRRSCYRSGLGFDGFHKNIEPIDDGHPYHR